MQKSRNYHDIAIFTLSTPLPHSYPYDIKIRECYSKSINFQGGEPTSQSRDKNIETGYNLVKFQSWKRHFRAVNCVFIYFILCLMRK